MKSRETRPVTLILALVAIVLAALLFRGFVAQKRFEGFLWVLVDRCGVLLWTGLILLAGLSSGCALLRRLKLLPARLGAAALFGVGTGLGLVSLLTLILGSLGIASALVCLAMLLVLAAVGFRELQRLGLGAAAGMRRLRNASLFRVALWCVLGLFAVMNLVRAFTPPSDYDSLEYHAAAPAAYHRAGRVFFMKSNVYANFPQNVEILYFLGMQLTESPDRGANVGQLLGSAMGLFAALAVGCMIGGLAGRDAGAAAAAIFYTWPGVTAYSGMPYVELPLIFYTTLAVWGVLWAWRRRRTTPGPVRWIALAGIATGLAIGVKYTAALLVLAPLGVSVFALSLIARTGLKEAVKRAALFGAIAVIVFSPWMVRNTINTGNPVYPLLYKVFGRSNWTAQKDARWTQAHSPKDRSPERFWKEINEVYRVGYRKQASVLMVLFIPFLLLCDRRHRAAAAYLAILAAVHFLLWFLFTQKNERFMEAGFTVVASLSALGLGAAMRMRFGPALKPLVIVLLLFAPSRWYNYFHVQNSLDVAIGATSRDSFFAEPGRSEFPASVHQAMMFLNDPENVPPNAKALFLGEARTFYCRRDCVASTVFDKHPLESVLVSGALPEGVRGHFAKAGITHILVNSAELMRLQESYRYRYKGREYLGMLDGLDWGLFNEFLLRHTRIVWPQAAPGGHYDWSRWPEFIKDYTTERKHKNPPQGHILAVYEIL